MSAVFTRPMGRPGALPSKSALACAVLLAASVAGAPVRAQDGNEVEIPPILQASQVLPPELLQGPQHRIADKVRNDGLLNYYTLNSKFGSIEVQGTELLYRRVHEINALAEMDKVRQSDAFVEALGKAAISPVKGAVGVVTDPVNTVTGVVQGTGKFFDSLGHSLFGSPSEQESGPVSTLIGYDAQKRKIAFEYGVDPYSYNQLLQERLVELARASTAGGLAVKVGFAFIPGPGKWAVKGTSLTSQLNQLVRDKTPAELKSINRKKLEAMGVAPALADPFLDHPKFSPSMTTHLVGALEQMKGVQNRDLYIARAVLAQNEFLAYALQERAKMHAAYHTRVKPIARFVAANNRPFAQSTDGRLLVIGPVDYLTWDQTSTPIVNTIMGQQQSLNITGYELWVTGTVSPLVRRNLESRGWQIYTKAGEKLTFDQ